MKQSTFSLLNRVISTLGLWILFYVLYIIVDVGAMFLVTGDGSASPIAHFMLALDRFIGRFFGYDNYSNPMLVSAGIYSAIIVFLIKMYKSSKQDEQDK